MKSDPMRFNEGWPQAVCPDGLKYGHVHVWRALMSPVNGPAELLRDRLSPDEQAKADRYRSRKDRQRYIAGRSMLRTLLAHFLRCGPQQIELKYLKRGKPVLADDRHGGSGLSFNLAHAHNVVLCAISRYLPVGVDVEYSGRTVDLDAIARRFFSPSEHAALRATAEDQRQLLFYRFWTCKEAYIKATGEGVSQLARAEIKYSPDAAMELVRASPWSLYEFSPLADYAAAVAVPGQGHSLFCWDYTSPEARWLPRGA